MSDGAAAELELVTERLKRVAAELDDEPSEERAAELVQEASKLATEAGEALERALRPDAEPPETPA
jgi:hypothetical protein